MKTEEFYRKYANLPLPQRLALIGGTINDPLTPSFIYERVKAIDDKIRPNIIERDNLIKVFEKFLSTNNK